MIAVFMVWSALGATARFALERVSALTRGDRFPYGTFTANVVGSAILGFAVGADVSKATMLAVAGFCGAFTTFGGFTAQAHARIVHAHTRKLGWTYWVVSIVASIAACALAYKLA